MLTSHIVSDYISVCFIFFSNSVTMWNHTFQAQNCFSQTPFHIALYKTCKCICQRNCDLLWLTVFSVLCDASVSEDQWTTQRTSATPNASVSYQYSSSLGLWPGQKLKGKYCAQSFFHLCNPRLGQGEDISLSEPAHCLLWISKTMNEVQLGLSS